MKKHKPVEEMGEERTVWSWLGRIGNSIGIVGTLIVAISYFIDSRIQFGKIELTLDQIRFEMTQMKSEIGEVKVELNEVKIDLNELQDGLEQTNKMFNADLTFRYGPVHTAALKKQIPVYDPINRTLKFVDPDSVKNP